MLLGREFMKAGDYESGEAVIKMVSVVTGGSIASAQIRMPVIAQESGTRSTATGVRAGTSACHTVGGTSATR